jgi:hypothetical protein
MKICHETLLARAYHVSIKKKVTPKIVRVENNIDVKGSLKKLHICSFASSPRENNIMQKRYLKVIPCHLNKLHLLLSDE